jgi:centromere protein I
LSYETGLLPEPLTDLVDLVTVPSHLDQASLNSMYPATRLSGDAVLKVVGCLGHGQLKPSLPIQAALLRWLVMVYHVLESPAVLSQAYSVLFNLLDTAAIRFVLVDSISRLHITDTKAVPGQTRPQLCHLLALITRRKHVRPFRIQSVWVCRGSFRPYLPSACGVLLTKVA